ncbi:MAG: hypothetical protein MHMPM18_001263 [Marteilia pararefringens]
MESNCFYGNCECGSDSKHANYTIYEGTSNELTTDNESSKVYNELVNDSTQSREYYDGSDEDSYEDSLPDTHEFGSYRFITSDSDELNNEGTIAFITEF